MTGQLELFLVYRYCILLNGVKCIVERMGDGEMPELVKSHLMFAVREEVNGLKAHITSAS